MRQAFMIGAIILWVAINILGAGAEMQTPMSQTDSKTGLTQQQTLEALRKPNITDANQVTIFSKIGSILILLGKVLTLWHPALWQGSMIYVYFIFLAIGISFWVVFALAIRGIGSS